MEVRHMPNHFLMCLSFTYFVLQIPYISLYLTCSLAQETPGLGEGATVIAANTDVGTCVCDLTSNACDVNCCCDGDCTTDDLASFTQCTDTVNVVDEQVCFRSSIVYKENVPETVNTTDPSLFCIVIDNNPARNYYTVPQLVDSVDRFTELTDEYGGTTFAPADDPATTYADVYAVNDPIYTVFEVLAVGSLGLPVTGYSSLCDDNNPAAYLVDQSTSCLRLVPDLETDCGVAPYLSALTFWDGFKIVPNPSYLATELPALNTTGEYDDFYVNGTLLAPTVQEPVLCEDRVTGERLNCSFGVDVVPTPQYNATTEQCENVVLEVAYTLTHNYSGIIELVEVQLVLGNVQTGDMYIQQSFSTAFVKASEGATFSRSGNPGYVVGLPILAGNLITQDVNGETRYAIELSSDPGNWLTVVRSAADGSCESQPDRRTPVNFGEDLRTGCKISVTFSETSDRCAEIQSTALTAMNGATREYAATFGNSAVEDVGDWVPIIYETITGNPTSSVEGTCNNMIMALHIDVIYGNAGSLANPQAKILGVRYDYVEGSTLKYTCSGALCQTGADTILQTFEVATSVAFVDASTRPAGILAEEPGFQDKLPNDFFYPFTIGPGVAVRCDGRALWVGVWVGLVTKMYCR